MQIRLDPPNAAAVRKEALAHRRVFKRKRSFSDVVNRLLFMAFDKQNQAAHMMQTYKTSKNKHDAS